MSRLIDDVARTLATPMPRRRALRTIGMALAVGAFPGLRPGRAAGSPEGSRSSCGDQTCGHGQADCCVDLKGTGRFNRVGCYDPKTRRCCIGPGPSGENATWTCPKCSGCGTYENTCSGGPQPEGCKKCGPDISDALGAAIGRTKSAFAGWSTLRQQAACDVLIEPPFATFSWDVSELSPAGRAKFVKKSQPDCGTCGNAVQVGRDCHFAGSANYVLYGAMMRLCHDHYEQSTVFKFAASFFTASAMSTYIEVHKTSASGKTAGNLGPATKWADAGWNGWPAAPAPGGDRPECDTCPKDYSGPGLTVQWFPTKIGP